MRVSSIEQVLILGYYGFGNVGDEAVLAAILRELATLWPGARFIVLSGDPQATIEEHGVESIFRYDVRAVSAALRTSQLLICGGGTLLQDVTSSRSLYYYLAMLLWARLYRLPVIIYGQGIGPLRHRWNQRLALWALGQTELVIVRDQGAYDQLLAWGFSREKLYLGADPVLSLKAPATNPLQDKLKGKLRGNGPVLFVSLRPWPSLVSSLALVATALDSLARDGWQIVFLPFQFKEDYPLCQRCAQMMDEYAVIWDQPLYAEEILPLFGQADYCLSMRLHALIFAAIWGIPMVGLAYDPKVKEFLKELGLGHLAFNLADATTRPIEPSSLAQALRRLAKEREEVVLQIEARTGELAERVHTATKRLGVHVGALAARTAIGRTEG